MQSRAYCEIGLDVVAGSESASTILHDHNGNSYEGECLQNNNVSDVNVATAIGSHCEMGLFDTPLPGPESHTRQFLCLSPDVYSTPRVSVPPAASPLAPARPKLSKHEKMAIMKRMAEKRAETGQRLSVSSNSSDPDDGGVESPFASKDLTSASNDESSVNTGRWVRPDCTNVGS